jgi:hypothetical protein
MECRLNRKPSTGAKNVKIRNKHERIFMSDTSVQTTPPSPTTHTHHCCDSDHACEAPHPFLANPKFKLAMCVLEKISLLALMVFAAYVDPILFFPFLGGGFILGLAVHYMQPKKESEHSHDHQTIGCSQGFIEQLTGVRLPPPVGLAANVAIAVCHIDHHSTVFVPLIGLNAGMWLAKLAIEYVPKAIEALKEGKALSTLQESLTQYYEQVTV